jgi:hypothetical protein
MSLEVPNAYDRTAQQVVGARAVPAPEMTDQIPADWLEEQEVVNPVSDAQGGVPSGVKFVGLPEGYAPVQEDLPRTAPAEADAKLRPPMRISREAIGWPHAAGESRRYADEISGGRPTDPSVITAREWQRPGISPFNGDGAGTTVKNGKVTGIGLWPSVSLPLIGTLAAAEAAVLRAEVEGLETQLGSISPAALSKAQDKYAAERATFVDLWTPIESSSTDETTLATAWAIATVRYRDGLKGAVSAAQSALKKSGVLAPVVAAAKAAALPVGILAAGVAAAGLYWMYLRKKH